MNLTKNILKSILEEKFFYYALFCSINEGLGVNEIHEKLLISKTKLYCYFSLLTGSGLITKKYLLTSSGLRAKKYLLTKDGVEVLQSLKINCSER